jgi:hypothetical protein
MDTFLASEALALGKRAIAAACHHCSVPSLQRAITATCHHCNVPSLQRAITAACYHCNVAWHETVTPVQEPQRKQYRLPEGCSTLPEEWLHLLEE